MLVSNITDCGPLAKTVIEAARGEIIALFSSSIYLCANDALCCLGTKAIPTGPLNIRTELQHLSEIKVGDRWTYEQQQLILSDSYQFSTLNTRYRKPSDPPELILNKDNVVALNSVTTALQEVIASYRANKDTALDTVTSNIIDTRLSEYKSMLSHWLWASGSLPADLTGLIGCGDGLTPAGDDILVGMLVALHILGVENSFSQLRTWVMKEAPGKTNSISHAHLIAACDGMAIDHVHTLLNLSTYFVMTNSSNNAVTIKNISNAAATLCHHGESSGFYTLLGVHITLQHLVKLNTFNRH